MSRNLTAEQIAMSNIITGGRGSDILTGTNRDDIITTSATNGASDRYAQDVIDLGVIAPGSLGNDVITDFDTNNFNGGEQNFDTLNFTFNERDFSLSTGEDIVDFVAYIESDGDLSTDAILDGNDIIFVFNRNDDGAITDSIRLEDVFNDDGITASRLYDASIDSLTSEDVFVGFEESQGPDEGPNVLIGNRGSDVFSGTTGDDVITTSAANGASSRSARDIVNLGVVAPGSVGNDIITDFDTNNFYGGERNFDTLNFTFNGQDFSLSTGRDIVDFVAYIESDGDRSTDAILDGDDIIFVFNRNEDGEITDSIRLQDIFNDDGITLARLNAASIDSLTSEDVFVAFEENTDGPDVLIGGEGDDILNGGAGDDELVGAGGDDELFGGEGNDRLFGGDDEDQLFGGDGEDLLSGEAGNDILDGGAGDDDFFGGAGDDDLNGGSGNDFLRGDDGDDNLFGGAGDDILAGSDGADFIDGGDGNDTNSFQGNDQGVTASLATGSAVSGGITESFINIENLVGTDFDDILIGDSGDNFLNGLDGNDILDGGAGDDDLFGGAGDDDLNGGSGNDFLFGGDGDDDLNGGSGNDFLDGGSGDDFLIGRAGTDELFGNAGNDWLLGGNGSDWLFGGDDNDELNGGAGDDGLFGEAGDDVLSGGAGDDTLDGGDGDDIAVFLDDLDNLTIVDNGDGTFTVSSSLDGTDELSNIESIQGGDGEIYNLTTIGTTQTDGVLVSVETPINFTPVAENSSTGAGFDNDQFEDTDFVSFSDISDVFEVA